MTLHVRWTHPPRRRDLEGIPERLLKSAENKKVRRDARHVANARRFMKAKQDQCDGQMYTARREYDPRATRKQVASLAGDWRAEAGHSMASTRRADHVAHTPAAPVSVRSSGFLARAGGMVCEGAGSLLRVGRLGARTPAHARVAGISGRETGQAGWHKGLAASRQSEVPQQVLSSAEIAIRHSQGVAHHGAAERVHVRAGRKRWLLSSTPAGIGGAFYDIQRGHSRRDTVHNMRGLANGMAAQCVLFCTPHARRGTTSPGTGASGGAAEGARTAQIWSTTADLATAAQSAARPTSSTYTGVRGRFSLPRSYAGRGATGDATGRRLVSSPRRTKTSDQVHAGAGTAARALGYGCRPRVRAIPSHQEEVRAIACTSQRPHLQSDASPAMGTGEGARIFRGACQRMSSGSGARAIFPPLDLRRARDAKFVGRKLSIRSTSSEGPQLVERFPLRTQVERRCNLEASDASDPSLRCSRRQATWLGRRFERKTHSAGRVDAGTGGTAHYAAGIEGGAFLSEGVWFSQVLIWGF
ncbi:hypothetical protein NFJ02_42g109610 [Pycnococcus provasolii]